MPKEGFGKFEYKNLTLYVGEWRLTDEGKKVKHGKGKIHFPGATDSLGRMIGGEEYDGEGIDDMMHGQGVYKFTGGNQYTGEWKNGMMNGHGEMIYADGSSYKGNW